MSLGRAIETPALMIQYCVNSVKPPPVPSLWLAGVCVVLSVVVAVDCWEAGTRAVVKVASGRI